MTRRMLNKRARFLLLHSLTPLLAGTLIYLLWRSDSLLVFRWLSLIHLSDPVLAAREALPDLSRYLPEWLLFSLPDGLWVYAATNALAAIWLGDWHTEARYWTLLPMLVGCAAEIGQATGQLPGTFSAMDIAATFGGGILGLLVIRATRPLDQNDETKNLT